MNANPVPPLWKEPSVLFPPPPGFSPSPVRGATIPVFLSSLDPSQTNGGQEAQNFMANVRVFTNTGWACGARLYSDPTYTNAVQCSPGGYSNHPYGSSAALGRIPDGESNTIAFATGYMNCGPDSILAVGAGQRFYYVSAAGQYGSFFGMPVPRAGATSTMPPPPTQPVFQVLPAMDWCGSTEVPQALLSTGISVGLLDGSVRMVSASISPSTWYAAMQPNDGRPLEPEWND